jgi:hypothetical protein
MPEPCLKKDIRFLWKNIFAAKRIGEKQGFLLPL